ncbi:MAG: P-loop NTPase [Peptococcaceae bacterium]|jgi:MinD superfamily P-loop ATPase|nr:P-loop NTPase [Peptococcaceae bacterium]
MQLTVISGKGGTGKTTIAVAIAELEKGQVVKTDCDVDAPNMYLYYQGKTREAESFSGGNKAIVDDLICNDCGQCQEVCKFDAIENGKVSYFNCEGCGACTLVCPQEAIRLLPEKTADIIVTENTDGFLIYAQMEIGSEGSGRLITVLRKKAQRYAGDNLIVIDGSPGIGCPVIASLTDTDAALVVTEPTQSGLEDLRRIVGLCKQLRTETFVCVNKADINEEMTKQIEGYCQTENISFVGKVPYDETVFRSINELKPIVYYEESAANKAIEQIWNNVKDSLGLSPSQ